MSSTLPTFIIAGAPKCGTTALWAYLGTHPEVRLCERKEPRFFSELVGDLAQGVTSDGHKWSGNFGLGFEWYASLFPEKPGARAIGEATTYYFSSSDTPALLRRHVPDVRLVFMLRDPAARTYSNYWQERKLGWDLPPFETMVREEHPRFRYYRRVSAYRDNLEAYLEHFRREDVLVLLQEDLNARPLEEFRRVCRFIGVDDAHEPPVLGKRVNEQTAPRLPRLEWMMRRASAGRLYRALPEPLRRSLGSARRAISAANATRIDYAPMAADVRAELLARFERDIGFVEAFLGRSLPAWRSVGARP